MLDHRTSTLTRAEQNRQNATHSTGPRTSTGKAISKLNAVKTGLTGRTVLLPSDDAARYEQHVENWIAELNPEGPRECALVQSIADSYWRAERIVRIEFALYAEGAASAWGEEDAKEAKQPNELDTYLRHERQLRNLSVQEGRLRRSREKDMKELRELQKEREERSQTTAVAAAKVNTTAGVAPPVPSPEEVTRTTTSESQRTGFVFTTPNSQLSARKENVAAQGQ